MSNIRDFQKKKTSDQPTLGDFETIQIPEVKNTIMDHRLYLKMDYQFEIFTQEIKNSLRIKYKTNYTFIYLSLIRIEELIRAIFDNFIFISDDLKIQLPATVPLFKDKTEKRIFKKTDLDSWIDTLNNNIISFIDVDVSNMTILKKNRDELIKKYIHIVTITNTDKIHKHPVAGFKGVKTNVGTMGIPQFTVLGSYAGLITFSKEKDSFLEYAWGFKTSYKNKKEIILYIKNNDKKKRVIISKKEITSINLLPEDLRKQVFTIAIDAKRKGNIFRFINDYRGVPKKYNPQGTYNCATVPIWNFKLKRPEFIVFTTRYIEPGRELFFDYGDDYWLGWTIEILKDKKKNERKFNSSQKKINDTTKWLSKGMNIINNPIL